MQKFFNRYLQKRWLPLIEMTTLFVVWILLSAAILWSARIEQTYAASGRIENIGGVPVFIGALPQEAQLPPSGGPVAVTLDGVRFQTTEAAFRPSGDFVVFLPASETDSNRAPKTSRKIEVSFRAKRLLVAAFEEKTKPLSFR